MIEELTPVGPIEAEAEPAPRPHRSVSQLGSYLRCPEGFRLEKIARAPARPAAWLTQGVAFHEAIEKWEGTGRTFPTSEAVAWFDSAWETMLAEQVEKEPDFSNWLTGGRTLPATDIENRFQRGRNQVAEYIQWATATAQEWRILEPAPDAYAVEVPFDLTFNGVRVIGFIDQLIEWRDGSVTVRDLKTGTKLPHGPRQLGIYALATEEVLGLRIEWGDYFMSKNIAPTNPYHLTRYTRERVGKWFADLDASIIEGRFIPNPGDHCRICPVAKFCDELGADAHLYPIERTDS